MDSLYTVYYNPGLPAGQRNALTASQRFALPGSSPAFNYPDSSYSADGNAGINSPAETITWFFAARHLDRDADQRLRPRAPGQRPDARDRHPERHPDHRPELLPVLLQADSRRRHLPWRRSTPCRRPGCRSGTPRASTACPSDTAAAARVDSLALGRGGVHRDQRAGRHRAAHPRHLLHGADAQRRDQEGHQLRRPPALRLGRDGHLDHQHRRLATRHLHAAALEPGDGRDRRRVGRAGLHHLAPNGGRDDLERAARLGARRRHLAELCRPVGRSSTRRTSTPSPPRTAPRRSRPMSTVTPPLHP